MDLDDVTKWLPIIVMGLAVVSALLNLGDWVILAIILGGLLVGLLNITKNEIVPFLVSTLVIAGSATILSSLPSIGIWLSGIFQNLAIAAGSIALFPAVKTIWEISSKK